MLGSGVKAIKWIAVLSALIVLPSSARAQAEDIDRYLASAARLYENLEYERALEQLKKASKLSRGADDDATIAVYEGIILADMDKREESLAAFKEGLLLKPDIKLPVRVSPKVAQVFEQVRAAAKKELAPLLAKQEKERQERQRAEQERQAQEAARAQEMRRIAAAGDRPTRVELAPTPGQPPIIEVTAPPPSRGVPVVPIVLAGIAAACGGVGAYLGAQSQSDANAASADHWQVDEFGHLRAARNEALGANVLFAAAGVAATSALVTWLATGR